MDRESALRQLDQIADELATAGQAGLAERTRDAASALRNGSVPHDDSGLPDNDAGQDDPSVVGDEELPPSDASSRGRAPWDDVVSPEQAAALLGVRSAPMMMRWAREGILEGMHQGGKVWIARSSVERLIDSDLVLREQQYEHELAEILDAFDAGDEELPPSASSSVGRKPWDSVGT